MLVVDASITVKWLSDEPDSALARSWLPSPPQDGLLHAPALMAVETHYVLSKRHLNGRLVIQPLRDAIGILSKTVVIHRVDADLVALAGSISLFGPRPFNIHDCVYIALALRLNHSLLTADAMQATMAELVGVSVERL